MPPNAVDPAYDYPRDVGYSLLSPVSLGEDATGELYIADIGNGSVFKIVRGRR